MGKTCPTAVAFCHQLARLSTTAARIRQRVANRNTAPTRIEQSLNKFCTTNRATNIKPIRSNDNHLQRDDAPAGRTDVRRLILLLMIYEKVSK